MKRIKIGVVIWALPFLLIPGLAGAALVNGGFEDTFLQGWSYDGTVSDPGSQSVVGTLFTRYEGERMASLHSPISDGPGHVTENYIMQDVELASGDNFLNFVYIFWTLDEAPFDNPGFLMEINGKTILSKKAGDIGDGIVGTLDYTTGDLDDGWTGISVPVAQYYDPIRPATIRISFSAGNTGDDAWASGVFIDGPREPEGPSLSPVPLEGYLVIPIPSSLLLLGSSLFALIGIRRRPLS
jgi:hypothetical protein